MYPIQHLEGVTNRQVPITGKQWMGTHMLCCSYSSLETESKGRIRKGGGENLLFHTGDRKAEKMVG